MNLELLVRAVECKPFTAIFILFSHLLELVMKLKNLSRKNNIDPIPALLIAIVQLVLVERTVSTKKQQLA